MDCPARDTLDRLLHRVKPVNLTRLLSDLFTCEKRMIFPTIIQLAELYGGFWTFNLEVLREWGEKLYHLILCLPSILPAVKDWLRQVIPNRTPQEGEYVEQAGFDEIKGIFSSINISTEGWTKPLLIIMGLIVTLGVMIGGGCIMSLTSFGGMIAKFATTLGQVTKNTEFIVSGFNGFFSTVLSGISNIFGIKLCPESPREILIKKIIAKTADIQDFHTKCTTDMASVIADPELFEKIKKDILEINHIYEDLARSRENLGNLRSLLDELNRVFKELIEYRDKLLAAIIGKQSPTVFWLFGKTGVGKSFFVKYLVDLLAKLEERTHLTVYSRSGADQYWSGYMGQDVVVYDDFSAVQSSCDHQELIDIYTPASYLLNMASLEEKGKRFTSRYVIICSNFSHIRTSQVLNDPSILDRRRDVFVEMLDEVALRLRDENHVNTPADHFKADWSHASFIECANFQDKDGMLSVLGQRRPLEIAQKLFDLQKVRKAKFMELLSLAQSEFDGTLPVEVMGPILGEIRRPVILQERSRSGRSRGDNGSGSFGTRVDNWVSALNDSPEIDGAAFQASLPMIINPPIPQVCVDRLNRLRDLPELSREEIEQQRLRIVELKMIENEEVKRRNAEMELSKRYVLPAPLSDTKKDGIRARAKALVREKAERTQHVALHSTAADGLVLNPNGELLIANPDYEPGFFDALKNGFFDGFASGLTEELEHFKEQAGVAFGEEIVQHENHRIPIVLLSGAPGTGKTEILRQIAHVKGCTVQCENFNSERVMLIDEIGLNVTHFQDCRQLVMNAYDGRTPDFDLIVLSGNPSSFERMFEDDMQRQAFYRRINEIFFFSFRKKYFIGSLTYGPSDIPTRGLDATVQIEQKSLGHNIPALMVEKTICNYKALHESYTVHRALVELPMEQFTHHIKIKESSEAFFTYCISDASLRKLLPGMWRKIEIKKGTVSDIYAHVYAIFGKIGCADVKIKDNLESAFCFLNNMQIPSPCNGVLLIDFTDMSFGVVTKIGEPIIIAKRASVKFLQSTNEVRKVNPDGTFEVTANTAVIRVVNKYQEELSVDIANLIGLGVREHCLALRDMPFFGPYFEIIDGFAELLKLGVGAYSIYEICRSANNNRKRNQGAMQHEGYVSDAEDDDDHMDIRRTNRIQTMRKTARSNREVKAFIEVYDSNLHKMVKMPVHYGDSDDEEAAPKRRFADVYSSEDVKSRTHTDPTVKYEAMYQDNNDKDIYYHGQGHALSNFCPVDIEIWGEMFPSVEHAYQWKHAQMRDRRELMEQIKTARSALAAKDLGKRLRTSGPDPWHGVKRDIMKDILRVKFRKEFFHEFLLKTGGVGLYHDVYDAFWGCLEGGKNVHGELLMELRSELEDESPKELEPKKTAKKVYAFAKQRVTRKEESPKELEPKKTAKKVYAFSKPKNSRKEEGSDCDYNYDVKRLKKKKTKISVDRNLDGTFEHQGIEFANERENDVIEEAMTDNQARAIVELLPKNTVYILKNEAVLCRGLMIYGRVGVTVEHALDLKPGDKFKVRTTDGLVVAEVLETNRTYDLMWFVLDNKARQFIDIRKHLISKEKDIHDLTGYDAILATISIDKGTNIFARAVQLTAVQTCNIAKKQKYGIGYTGTCTSYEYQPILTMNGDCGSPLIMINSTRMRKIVSIHNAASTTSGFGSLLFVEDVPEYQEEGVEKKNGITILPHQSIELCELEDYKLFKGIGKCVIDGELVNNFSNGKTRIWRSPLAFPEKFGDTHEPAVLSNKDPRMTEGANPLEDAMDKWSHEQPEVDKKVWDEAVDHVADKVSQTILRVCGPIMKVLTKTEAINRYARISTSNPIYRHTSSGYPFKHWRGVVKKEVFFEQIEIDGVLVYTISKNEYGEKLNNCVDRLIQAASRGERSGVVFSGTLKDEVLKKKKIYSVTATRSFAGSPLDYTIAHRMYLHTAVAALAEARAHLPIKVGIDAHSIEWNELYYYLTKSSDYGFDLDYSLWDATVPKFAMESLPTIYNRIYKLCDPNWKEEDDVVRIALHSVLHGPLVSYYDCIVQLPGGQVSGQPATAIDNCLINMIYMCYYWKKLAQRLAPKMQSLIRMDENVSYAVYGDDNICMVTPEVQDWFNLETVMTEATKIGLTVTSAAKDGQIIPIQPIWNLGFLKRGFKKLEIKGEKTKFVCGPLETVSIGKTLAYTSINREHDFWRDMEEVNFDAETIRSTIRSVMEEACLHGAEFYNELKLHCCRKACALGLDVSIPTIQEQLIATYFK